MLSWRVTEAVLLCKRDALLWRKVGFANGERTRGRSNRLVRPRHDIESAIREVDVTIVGHQASCVSAARERWMLPKCNLATTTVVYDYIDPKPVRNRHIHRPGSGSPRYVAHQQKTERPYQ
jgi:hypothetical protein